MKTMIMFLVLILATVSFSSCGSGNAAVRTRQVIFTVDAPTPVGAYSQGILFNNTLTCAGQIGIDPITGELVTGGVVAEAEQALKNLGAVLRAAGMDYEDVNMATIFLTDINDYTAVNELYATYFSTEPPARQVIVISALPRSASVEISLSAMKDLNP